MKPVNFSSQVHRGRLNSYRRAVSLLIAMCCIVPACDKPSSDPETVDIEVPDYNATYDLAVLDGQVVDGSGRSAAAGAVLIENGTVSFVGTVDAGRLKTLRTIDAGGRVVTPGFIDTHAHGDPLIGGSLSNFLVQGVTTVVLGQDGRTPGAGGESPTGLAEWMRNVDRHGVAVNVATLSGHGTLRTRSGAGVETPATPDQLSAMAKGLREDLDAGAFGLSTGLEYVPGRYATSRELVTLAEIVGAVDGVVMSHLRSEDDDKIEAAIDELIEQGEHARVHVSHLKIVFASDRIQAVQVLEQLQAARDSGIRISADVYPYLAGFADLSLVYPPWAKTREQFEAALEQRREELSDYLFERVNKRNGPENILIASGEYASMTLAEAAASRALTFVEMIMDEFDFGGPAAAHFIMNKEVQDEFILADGVAIATDGGPWIRHPRSYGTYPRIIEDYVLTGRIALTLAIYKMTGLPASIAGLHNRGQLARGKKADLLIFDPAKVRSLATWSRYDQAPEGLDFVIIDGRVAIEDGVPASGLYGRVLRRERE